MSTITNVFSNSLEDLIDDYTTTVVFKQSKKALDPLKKDFEKEDSGDWDDAVSGAISTLQMGLSMYAIGWINSTLMPMVYKRASIAFGYIVGGKLVGAFSKLKSGGVTGKVLGKAVGTVVGSIESRQKNTEIAINMMNHNDSMMIQKMKMANHTKNRVDGSMLKGYTEGQLKNVELMSQKTKTGTWTNSRDDKKIYERATGKKLTAGVSWSKLYKKLNSFQEFAKNAEDEVISKAQVEFDTFVANGLSKVK